MPAGSAGPFPPCRAFALGQRAGYSIARVPPGHLRWATPPIQIKTSSGRADARRSTVTCRAPAVQFSNSALSETHTARFRTGESRPKGLTSVPHDPFHWLGEGGKLIPRRFAEVGNFSRLASELNTFCPCP